jgi:hypothetical protein
VFLNLDIVNRTAIGLRVKGGVVLAVEKLVQSKLVVPGSNKRIMSADMHVGIVCIRFSNHNKSMDERMFLTRSIIRFLLDYSLMDVM